jgi:hypothetical protein
MRPTVAGTTRLGLQRRANQLNAAFEEAFENPCSVVEDCGPHRRPGFGRPLLALPFADFAISEPPNPRQDCSNALIRCSS